MTGLEGTRLGRYRLMRRLGRGGMSEVYLANDELMHREVAVKIVSSTHTEYIERFQREAEAIGGLQHDHILPAFDFGEQPPWHYLVMPYIEYCTLLDVLEKGPLSLDHAGELLLQIASGLQYAHNHGVIHRDIKPSNILLRDDHYAYLADFGLAKSLGDAGKVTQTGVLLGTPEYMAPELADGPATESSDNYALGILLYQMVTGKMPFTGDSSLAVYLKQMREQPMPPSRINPKIPHAVELVIMRALEKDPRRRYPSAMALAQAYLRALEMTDAQASPPLQHRPTLYDTVEAQSIAPANPEPHRDSAYPAAPHQQERLVLPPDPQAAQRKPTPVRNDMHARQTPVYPRDLQPRYVPARRRNRISTLNLSVLIGLLFLVLVALIFYAVYSHGNNNQNTQKTPQATAGSSVTASTPTPTPTINASAQAGSGTATAVTSNPPLLNDSLSSNTNGSWSNDGTSCSFRDGTYHVLVSQADTLQPCTNTQFTFSNGAIKVDLSLLQGSDAGIIFRESGDQFYDFEITSQRQYFFRRHDANGGANYVRLVPNTYNAAIAPGSATNTLLMIANGSNFLLYINGTLVKEVQDANFSSGGIGFVAGTLAPVSSADASFSNLTVYPLS